MTTFVLVHGAWTGAHVWRTVRALLWSRGHEVFTPGLTGLGERAHLARPDIDLELHVEDVLAVMRYENLRDVTLVGHSYGAVVAAVAADRAVDRVSHVACLDALVPADGESVQDLRRHAAPTGDWIAPPRFRDVDPVRLPRLLAAARLSMQPARTFRQPVRLAVPLEERPFARAYVRATGHGHSPPYERAAAAARASAAWSYHEWDAGHDLVPRDAPALAELLCSVSAGRQDR